MNNKELQIKLSQRLSITQKEAFKFLNAFVQEYSQHFEVFDEVQVPFLKMGTFVVKKKDQRIIVNPISKNKMLVPPKLALSFRPTQSFKNKIKEEITK